MGRSPEFSSADSLDRLRASVPLIAGIFEMPFWRFQVANFSSAFVWAAVLLTIGDVISKAVKWALVISD